MSVVSSVKHKTILCEFSDNDNFNPSIIDHLNCISNGYETWLEMHTYKYCKILENHWQSWQGGDGQCPLPQGLIVVLQLRNGNTYVVPNGTWSHEYIGDSNVIAFKVVGVADGWSYVDSSNGIVK